MRKLIGVLHGTEGPFPYDLVESINKRNAGVKAEMIEIGAVGAGDECRYDVILDRISHLLPYFRDYTRNAFLSGTYVINNPFRFYREKYFAYGVARRLGIHTPRTVLLPMKSYPEGIRDSDLENLEYPLKWEKIVESAGGYPAVLKPSENGLWRDVHIVNNHDELLKAYNNSGNRVMILQEYIRFDHYVRVLVLGKKHVLPIKYNPRYRDNPSLPAYEVDHEHLSPELGEKIEMQAKTLCRVMDYDMNSVEFAIRDGVPFAIDFYNPVPDARPEVVTRFYYDWILDHMTGVCIDYALSPPPISAWPSIQRFINREMERRAGGLSQKDFLWRRD